MKKQLLFFTLLGLISFCKAQDQLFKRDNSKLLVKVTEISPDEIKYKLFDNLNGPTYVVSKKDVLLIIFENGKHEVITRAAPPTEPVPAPGQSNPALSYSRPGFFMSSQDSLKYFRHTESVSLNFFNFINMEVGLIYQKDFLRSNFGIIIPLAVGIQSPIVTQSAYFKSGVVGSSSGISLGHKQFEAGFGFNYYPSLKSPVNYYVGPVIRYMQYECEEVYYYYPTPTPGSYRSAVRIGKTGTLSRYCISLTNGFIFRTKSRLMMNLFGSLGFKNDIVNTKIVDPNTNAEVKPVSAAVNIYFWTGCALGFSF